MNLRAHTYPGEHSGPHPLRRFALGYRLAVVGILCAAVGGVASWTFLRKAQPTSVPAVAAVNPKPQSTPSQGLLDALAEAASAGHPDQVGRYTQAIVALGPEALPELHQRLQKEGLPTEVVATYASALVENRRKLGLKP